MLVGLETPLEACLCFRFIDNEAAKACWIAGFARSVTAQKVIHNGTMREAAVDLHRSSLVSPHNQTSAMIRREEGFMNWKLLARRERLCPTA